MGAVGVNLGSGSGSTVLVYGNDSGANIPKTIADFEEKRKNAKIEFSILAMENGDVIETNKGGHGSVKSSLAAHSVADILSHNHPVNPKLGEGAYSGTFSSADMNNFMEFNQVTYRAVAAEGIYSMTKGEALKNDVHLRAELYKAYKAHLDGIHADAVKAGKVLAAEYTKEYKDIVSKKDSLTSEQIKTMANNAYSKYMKGVKDESNRGLVSMHNWLLNHQKQYGYTYGLIKN